MRERQAVAHRIDDRESASGTRSNTRTSVRPPALESGARSDAPTLARARALLAARVVTLGLAAAATAGGCAMSRERREEGDAGRRGDASVVSDAGTGDAGCPPFAGGTPPATRACCESMGFPWDSTRGRCIVAVPGPFVPPSLVS